MLKVFNLYIPLRAGVEVLIDLIVSLLAFGLGTATVFLTWPGPHDWQHWLRSGMGPSIVYALITVSIYAGLGMYRYEQRMRLRGMLVRVIIAFGFAFFPVYAFTWAFTMAESAFRVLGFALLFQIAIMVLFRHMLVGGSPLVAHTRRVLVVGTGREAQALAQDLTREYGSLYRIVGFYPAGAGNEPPVQLSAPLFDRSVNLDEVVRRERADEVVVAVREQRGGVLPIRHLLECRIKGVPVLSLASFYERIKGEVPLDSLKASWLIYGGGFVQGRLRTWVKRAFDIVAASILLLVLWPFMLITALAIKLEDGGPVFFNQERVGQFGRTFRVHKFRSMRVDAEKDGKAVWAKANDDRVTRIGRFIRKTRIDELPQLFNVLAGEMSMVGPRPERPTFVDMLEKDVPYYAIRHSVKPGVTGWAQVRYAYGASVEDSRRKLQFDLYYVKNHNFFLDLFVLFETVRVVLFGEGAR